MAITDRDRSYFARLGGYKEASHAQVASEHLALSLADRLARSWALYEEFRKTASATRDDAGPLAFYQRARALGLLRR